MIQDTQSVQFTPEEIAAGKYIKMPAQALADWLTDLRSGKFTQGKGDLFNPRNDSYCCLGLQQRRKGYHGIIEDVEGLPSLGYLESNGIQFRAKMGHYVRDPLIVLAGGETLLASEANDKGVSFAEIADAIERVAVGY